MISCNFLKDCFIWKHNNCRGIDQSGESRSQVLKSFIFIFPPTLSLDFLHWGFGMVCGFWHLLHYVLLGHSCFRLWIFGIWNVCSLFHLFRFRLILLLRLLKWFWNGLTSLFIQSLFLFCCLFLNWHWLIFFSTIFIGKHLLKVLLSWSLLR